MDKSPSRERYEKDNPVVSFRISKDSKEELEDIVDTLDTTKKEWLEGVIRDSQENVSDAWEKGYDAAQAKYCVEIPCVICGEPMPVTSDDCKEQIGDVLVKVAENEGEEAFWWRGHKDCL